MRFRIIRPPWKRLRLEARSASSLNHPNICTIYEIGDTAGQPFVAMEMLEGSTLRDRIAEGTLPPAESVEFGYQIAGGLEAAHRTGIVHRDIKPANIFITTQGHAKILDFGLAKATGHEGKGPAGDGLSGSGAAGTIDYMSPEQVLARPLDARSDLFSFGVVLYQMVTGRMPFTGATDAAIFEAILHTIPASPSDLNPDVPPSLNRIINRCLEKDREQRYPDAAEIRSDLQGVRREAERAAISRAGIPWSLLVPAVALVFAAMAGWYWYSHRTPRLSDKDTIVLADFTNRTGDAVFDGTLRQGLAVQLEQSPFLSVVPDESMQHTLQMMAKPADSPVTPELAREICERTGSAAVLEGSIAKLGAQYVLGLTARSCRTGNVIYEEQLQAAKKEDVLNALTQVAGVFRARVGESPAMVIEHNTPLPEATTASLEALKAYSAARKISLAVGAGPSLPLLLRAVEIDPQFSMAHASLGLTYASMGESDLSAESTTKAYTFRNRANERERFFIAANYDREVTRNLEKAQQTCELWSHTYPRDTDAHALSSGFISQGVGNYQRSIEEAKKAIDLNPDHSFAYANLAGGYFWLNRLSEAEDTIRRASERRLDIPEFLLLRYYIAFLKGDAAAMHRQAAQARGKSGAEDWLEHSEALVLARSGKLEAARSMSGRAADVAQQIGQRERAATYQTATAVWEGFFGNALAAKQNALAALKLSKGRDVQYAAAFALAVAGGQSLPEGIANELAKRYPEDTSVRFTYVPILKAMVAKNSRAPAQAIVLLTAAVPYELTTPGITFFDFSVAFTRLMCAVKLTSICIRALKPLPSSRKFLTIPRLLSPILSALWHTWKWAERCGCQER
jgi:tetratricopeptide (TPR) repeat protein